MAITFVGAGTADEQTAASTSSTPGYPSGLANNDLLLLFGVSGATVNTTFTNPTGFTQIAQLSNTGNTIAPNAYMARKFATGSETGTLTCSHGSVISSMGMIALRGVSTTTPLDIAVVTTDKTTANSSFTFSGVPVTNGTTAVYVATPASTTITGTPPSGYTEDFDRTATGARAWNVGHKLNLASGATGTQTGSWNTSAKDVVIAVFIRPAVPPVTSNIFYKNSSGVYVAGTLMLPDGAGGYV